MYNKFKVAKCGKERGTKWQVSTVKSRIKGCSILMASLVYNSSNIYILIG